MSNHQQDKQEDNKKSGKILTTSKSRKSVQMLSYGFFSLNAPDEDIPTVDTTVVPTATLPHIPQFQGPLTRARARQLNYQVLSFLGTIPNIHENMMLPKSNVFMLLRNDGPSMDERDKHSSMIMHGDDGSNHVRIQDDATSEDFRTLKPP
jgi:hypothetical protein